MSVPVSPNQLTVLRMAVVPVLILLIVYGYTGWALVTFVLAGLTDMLDGLIARRWSRRTHLGTFLDPIADKLLLVSSFTILTFGSLELTVRIPLWLTITVISRDLLLVLSVLIFNLTIGRRAFPPSILGKCTTVSQLLLVMMVLSGNWLEFVLPGTTVAVYLTLVLTVASGLHYMAQGMGLVARASAESPES
ncbi:MAG: CDP-alcohol phosphatidyltransferase family protein [Acidobacteriota bacterium]